MLLPSGFEAPGQVNAHDTTDGELRWSHRTGDTAFVQAVGSDLAIVSPDRGEVTAIDIATGQETWHLRLEDDESPGKATIDGDTVYLGTSVTFEGASDPVVAYAIDRDGGQVRWRTTLDPSSVLQWSAPVVADGLVFFLESPSGESGTTPARAVALDAATGEVRWSADLGSTNPGLHYQPALYAQGVLIAPTGGGQVVGIEAATGQRSWTYQGNGSVPALASRGGGVVYVAVGGRVLALDLRTGSVEWEAAIPADAREPWIAIQDRAVLAGTDLGLAAFDAGTGASLWTVEIGSLVGPPVLAGGKVYATTSDEAVAADALSGDVTWRAAPPAGAFVGTAAPTQAAVVLVTDQSKLVAYRD